MTIFQTSRQGLFFVVDLPDAGVLKDYLEDHASALGAKVQKEVTSETTHVIVTHAGQPLVSAVMGMDQKHGGGLDTVNFDWFYESVLSTESDSALLCSPSLYPVRNSWHGMYCIGI